MIKNFLYQAGWQSGHAAACKAVYSGSIPDSASINNSLCTFQAIFNRIHFQIKYFCPGGGIGRHKGLKIPRRQLRAGSSPALGTK